MLSTYYDLHMQRVETHLWHREFDNVRLLCSDGRRPNPGLAARASLGEWLDDLGQSRRVSERLFDARHHGPEQLLPAHPEVQRVPPPEQRLRRSASGPPQRGEAGVVLLQRGRHRTELRAARGQDGIARVESEGGGLIGLGAGRVAAASRGGASGGEEPVETRGREGEPRGRGAVPRAQQRKTLCAGCERRERLREAVVEEQRCVAACLVLESHPLARSEGCARGEDDCAVSGDHHGRPRRLALCGTTRAVVAQVKRWEEQHPLGAACCLVGDRKCARADDRLRPGEHLEPLGVARRTPLRGREERQETAARVAKVLALRQRRRVQ
mmetsp:Transcript_6401/g.19831  ORF Transcript_6401/g.19831 Transcript_6401/m.19831 type:complete len:326 (-) Transcript_6401:809-1786(-)